MPFVMTDKEQTDKRQGFDRNPPTAFMEENLVNPACENKMLLLQELLKSQVWTVHT